jgi:transposase
MNYLRRIAVRAMEEKNYSPELVADFLGIDRTSIYDWLRKYRQEGEKSLDTGKAPGAERVITPDIDRWLKETILTTTGVTSRARPWVRPRGGVGSFGV